jgi:8-oxo-dGTP pyrophosphatase MutT (NUDIX family)
MVEPLNPSCTPACTVLLLRDGPAGLEVFLVQRNTRSGFMASLWVFPGGRVEPSDAELPEALATGGAAMERGWAPADARRMLVAGAREAMEESGLWLGTGEVDGDARARIAAGELGLAAWMEGAGATLDLDRLAPWARWVTPEGEGRRFDTAFVVARADGPGRHDDQETVASAWVTPRDALAGGFVGYPLAPPTFWAITELTLFADVDQVIAASAGRDLRPVQPVRDLFGGRLVMRLPGDPGHPEAGRPGLPIRIVMEEGQWAAQFAG